MSTDDARLLPTTWAQAGYTHALAGRAAHVGRPAVLSRRMPACLPACLHPIQFVLSFDLGVLRICLFSQILRGLMFSLVPFQRDAPSHEVSSVDLLPLSSSDCWMAPSKVRSPPPTHCRCAAMRPPLRLHLPSRSQSSLQTSTSNLQQSTDRPTTYTVDTTQRD